MASGLLWIFYVKGERQLIQFMGPGRIHACHRRGLLNDRRAFLLASTSGESRHEELNLILTSNATS